ncbi:MAG: glycine cleavage system aminomethyltransferase GcvT [Pseudomonadota bacterium]
MGQTDLKRTPLYDQHVANGAKMVDFAGYAMPVQYGDGIIAEHLHTRASASVFDVSHMGQAVLRGPDADAVLESVTCADLSTLKPGRIRYSLLMNENGGIIDDLMITRLQDGSLSLVLNASRKYIDMQMIAAACVGKDAAIKLLEDAALIALQGPRAGAILEPLLPHCADMAFMDALPTVFEGDAVLVSRCGYTGEDGFEVSVPAAKAAALTKAILANEEAGLAGLGARDSLRLECGLCLYGHDIDETTTPVEAGLTFAIGKRRKMARDFPGAQRVMRQLEDGCDRMRVGLMIEGRRPAREGAAILSPDGTKVGAVTSGSYSPTLERPIAMGYVAREYSQDGLALQVDLRGKAVPAQVAPMPVVPQRYRRRSAMIAEQQKAGGQ